MPNNELVRMTWENLVDSVAWEFGITLKYGEAGHILWNQTGYPCFWRTGHPIDDCTESLRDFFSGVRHCACCGAKDRPLNDRELCEQCMGDIDAVSH